MLTIGTRGSELALWQARHVQARLGGEAAGVQLKIVKTSGDQILNIPLAEYSEARRSLDSLAVSVN